MANRLATAAAFFGAVAANGALADRPVSYTFVDVSSYFRTLPDGMYAESDASARFAFVLPDGTPVIITARSCKELAEKGLTESIAEHQRSMAKKTITDAINNEGGHVTLEQLSADIATAVTQARHACTNPARVSQGRGVKAAMG